MSLFGCSKEYVRFYPKLFTGKVLAVDLSKGKVLPGTAVIVEDHKDADCDNQLWYEDDNKIIRSKIKDYAMDASGNYFRMYPFDVNNDKQKWVYEAAIIRNRKMDLTLDFEKQKAEDGTMNRVAPRKGDTSLEQAISME